MPWYQLQSASNSRTYGASFLGEDGSMYYHWLPPWQRPLYRLTVWLQSALWHVGIPWHNRVFDECTPDGDCCRNISHNLEDLT